MYEEGTSLFKKEIYLESFQKFKFVVDNTKFSSVFEDKKQVLSYDFLVDSCIGLKNYEASVSYNKRFEEIIEEKLSKI